MAKSKKGSEKSSSSKGKKRRIIPQWVKLSIVAGIMTVIVLAVSVVLMVLAWEREELDDSLTDQTSYNVGGVVEQSAPSLNAVGSESAYYKDEVREYGSAVALSNVEEYAENTNLVSTKGDVTITVDSKKRGLRYEPTFKTEFSAVYVLENELEKESLIEFEFPFPENVRNKEINNANLFVDGVEQPGAVKREEVNNDPPYVYYEEEYGYDYDYDYGDSDSYKSGLYWEGKVPAGGQVEIEVKYNTVGLSRFSYEGIENPEGSQDFEFDMTLIGSRKYNNEGSLSIDSKDYITEEGKSGMVLHWKKSDLFSKPEIQVSVATRVNPSKHLGAIYKIMTPLYVAFAGGLIVMLTLRKKKFGNVDMILVSTLFIVFFPFLHYLVSFNIDPSADILSGVGREIEFTMPLYGAFAIAYTVISGLVVYLVGRMTSGRFALGITLPLTIVFMAFFPLAMTVPEYKGLLALIGTVALLAVLVQMRVKARS